MLLNLHEQAPWHRFCSGAGGRLSPHWSIITRRLLRSEDQYVGQGKGRSSYPAAWDKGCVMIITPPRWHSLPPSKTPRWKAGGEVSAALLGDALWAHLPCAGWSLGKPGLTRPLQRCLCGAWSFWANEKVLLFPKVQTSTEPCFERETDSDQYSSAAILLQEPSWQVHNTVQSAVYLHLFCLKLSYYFIKRRKKTSK